jgi:hypothetical protein
MAGEQTIPLDISCAHLDLMRWQKANEGVVTIGNARPIIPARQAILTEIAGDAVKFVDGVSNFILQIPETTDPKSQRLIAEARVEAELAGCWWVQAACVVADKRGRIVKRSHNDPAVGTDICSSLRVNPQEVIAMLKPGERLEFCQGVHDVEMMVAKAAVERGGLANKISK